MSTRRATTTCPACGTDRPASLEDCACGASSPIRHQLTTEDRRRSRVSQQLTQRLRREITETARRAVEALAVEHPGALEDLDTTEIARLAATRIALDIIAGSVPPSALDSAGRAVRSLIDVARIESGQPTHLTASLALSSADVREWLASVRRSVGAPLPIDEPVGGSGTS